MSWIALFAVPIYGTISYRLGKRKIFIVIGALLVCIVEATAAYSSGFMIVALIVALGLVSAMVPGNVQTLPSEILGPERASVGFTILGICMNIGNTVSQPLIGMIIDATNSYSFSILSMAAFAALCCFSALFIKSK